MDLAAGNSAASSDRITDLGLGKAVADGDGTRPACAGDSDSTNANRTYGTTRRGLFTSHQNHAENFADTPDAPFPASGTEFAFRDPSLESNGEVPVRVASIVPFLVMKAYAILERDKAKDAYDFHFCLQNYPHGIPALATEFIPVIDDPAVKDVFVRLADRFRDEESSGPRRVVEVEQPMGESQAIRKFAVFTNGDDFH